MKIIKAKTSDGYHYSGLYSSSPDSKKIVVHIHGMAGSPILNQFYESMHTIYPQKGISFLVGEHRGTGIITPFVHDNTDGVCGNAFEIFEDSILDIKAWVDAAVGLGYEEIWLQGHSLGPSKIAYYVANEAHPRVKGVIYISPSDMAGLVRTQDAISLHQSMLAEAEMFVANGKAESILS
jgi:alpha-beta hydrolase superfamily lysophospholipase